MATNSTTTPIPKNPRVGVAVFVLRPSNSNPNSTPTPTSQAPSSSTLEFIVGRRLGSHGAGTIALPGGHLEWNESFETCAAREVLEETGLVVNNIQFLTATNDVMSDEGKHYITIFVTCQIAKEGEDDDANGKVEPEVLEPNKCAGWEWVTWEKIVGWVEGGEGREAQKVFLPIVNLVKQRPGIVPQLL